MEKNSSSFFRVKNQLIYMGFDPANFDVHVATPQVDDCAVSRLCGRDGASS